MTQFATIEEAVKEIAAGRPVIVVDDEDRENEGDLIFAAQFATPELLAFMVRYTSGYVCVPLPEPEADRLDLPPMFHTNQDRRGTAYAVTVDAREGISTGISAADRAHTIRLLASADTKPTDLSRPGHVVPLRAKAGGVLRRPGHTEAAIDLAVLAGARPAGVLCEMVNDDGTMMRLPDLTAFAAELATPELLAFTVRYTSGYICAPVTEEDADRLELPPMYHTNQDRRGTAYAVTVDAREGVSTGISAADRAHTIRLLASADTFDVGLIPTTLKLTVLGAKSVGDPVNLEVDVIAKYVERLLGAQGTRTAGTAR